MPGARAKIAGVIGWPVAHSLSPKLHHYWLRERGIDGCYIPLPVAPEHLEHVLRALPLMGFRGVNLTVPHKEQALCLVDDADETAQRIGAVNTIVIEDGKLLGRNTDAYGFIGNLRAQIPGEIEAYLEKAVVIGAGGAARAVVCGLLDAGAQRVTVANRTLARACELADAFGPRVEPVPWEGRAEALAGAALLVNATTLGMVGHPPLELALDRLPQQALVTDIVYTPLETPLLTQAKARGHQVADGLGMLIHQAIPGFAAWFGAAPEATPALRAHLLAKEDA